MIVQNMSYNTDNNLINKTNFINITLMLSKKKKVLSMFFFLKLYLFNIYSLLF